MSDFTIKQRQAAGCSVGHVEVERSLTTSALADAVLHVRHRCRPSKWSHSRQACRMKDRILLFIYSFLSLRDVRRNAGCNRKTRCSLRRQTSPPVPPPDRPDDLNDTYASTLILAYSVHYITSSSAVADKPARRAA